MSAAPNPHDDPIDIASFWFNRRRAGDMSEHDAHALECWLAETETHKAIFDEIERMWSQVGDMEDEPTVLEMREDVRRALDAARQGRNLMGIAAGVILVAAGGWAAIQSGLVGEMALLAPHPMEFRTSVGQRTTVTLPDQSVVTLDTDTLMRARITLWERRIELDRGQAFFEVAKDRSRPFIVAAAGRTVRATGTAFDVRVEPNRFEVTLIEGRVRVQEKGAEGENVPRADMRAGWRLAVGDDKRWRMEPVDLDKVTTWHTGTLTFFFDPLKDAVDEMNRYSDRKIVFENEPLDTPVLGNFRAGDLENFARAMRMNKLARVVRETKSEIVIAAW